MGQWSPLVSSLSSPHTVVKSAVSHPCSSLGLADRNKTGLGQSPSSLELRDSSCVSDYRIDLFSLMVLFSVDVFFCS